MHAGDICEAAVLDELSRIAPVTAVRGNNDKGAWTDALQAIEWLPFGDVLLYVIHDIAQIDIDPAAAGVRVVVSGHSHRPRIEERDGVLFVNPGSAGPRRFSLPISAAEILIGDGRASARIVELSCKRPETTTS